MTDITSELSPTIETLDTNRDIENLSGSPLMKRKKLFGKEYSFYDDGSVLVIDPSQQEYHFITREGREKGRELRRPAEDIIKNNQRLSKMKMLGEGKGGLSKVFELDTPVGPIAIKATDEIGFYLKEKAEKETKKGKFTDPRSKLTRKRTSRIIIQKMSLADTMRLFRKLDEKGIRTPEFYGFTVRRNPNSNEIQEFQFMERIDRPTVQSIVKTASEAEQIKSKHGFSKSEYAGFLDDLSDRYFHNDDDALIKSIIYSFYDFVRDVKEVVPNIADLEMDNIFLVGYNQAEEKPEFMLIDPIEEEVLIPLLPMNHSNVSLMKHNELEQINVPND